MEVGTQVSGIGFEGFELFLQFPQGLPGTRSKDSANHFLLVEILHNSNWVDTSVKQNVIILGSGCK